MVTHSYAAKGGRTAARHGALTRSRVVAGWVLASSARSPSSLRPRCRPLRGDSRLRQRPAAVPRARGRRRPGRRPAGPRVVAAVIGEPAAQLVLHPAAAHASRSPSAEHALALVVFVVVAVVGRLRRRPRRPADPAGRAGRAPRRRSCRTLAGSVLRGETALPALLERLRETFGLHLGHPARASPSRGGPGSRSTVAGWPPLPAAGGGRRRHRRVDRTLDAAPCAAGPLRRGRPAGAQRLRRPGRRRSCERERLAAAAAEAHQLAAGQPRCGPRCSPRSATTCAPRWPRSRPRSPACASTTCTGRPRTRPSCSATIEESADRLDRARRQPARHEPAAGRRASRPRAGRSALDEVVPPAARRPGAGRHERVASTCPRTCPRCTPTRACSSGSSPTCVEQRAAVHARRTPRSWSPAARVADRRRAPGRRPRPRRPRRRDQERIFAPFQRLGDAPTATGVGLGLAVARGLTEAMGGTLTAEDTPGGGLTMVVSLPAGRRPVGQDAARAVTPMTRVLVVDDEPPIAAGPARSTCAPAATRSTPRRDGRDALSSSPPRDHPDVVILDLGLPDMDGIEVIAGLRGWTSADHRAVRPRTTATTRSRRSTPAPTTT